MENKSKKNALFVCETYFMIKKAKDSLKKWHILCLLPSQCLRLRAVSHGKIIVQKSVLSDNPKDVQIITLALKIIIADIPPVYEELRVI